MLDFIVMAGGLCWVLIAGALGVISAHTASGLVQLIVTLAVAALALRTIVYLLGDHRDSRAANRDQHV